MLRMNWRFIFIVTLGLMFLDWCLFFAIFFYFPDIPPSGLVQRLMIDALMILTFPFIWVVLLFQLDAGLFLTSGVLFLVSALVWAVALERLLHLSLGPNPRSPA